MKMSIASIAVVLVYLLSFVTADHQPDIMMVSAQDNQMKGMAAKMRGADAVVP
ncbi:hypothetical protein L917_21242, partial [Phytophthora nicotianae]